MKELTELLVLTVHAQAADTTARPTFTTDIDFDNLSGGDDDTDSDDDTDNDNAVAKITLDSSGTNFSVNSEFTVQIEVDSDGATATDYTVKVEFPVDILQVVDSNTSVSGTQITFSDTDFTATDNTVSNTNGTIVLQAEASSAQEISGVVAEIKFKVIAEGDADITVVKAESSIVNSSATNILQQVTSLQVKAGSSIGSADQIIDDPLLPSGGISSFPKDLPESDLPFSGLFYVLVGIGLIYMGLLGKKLSHKSKRH